jgi:flagellar protein FliJ
MARNFSLQPLLDLMRDRTDEATRQLGRLIAAEQNARSRLEMLEQYRAEYAERLRASIAEGLTVQAINNYQEFLQRIDTAIEQQTRQVQLSEDETGRGKQNWQEQNSRLKAIDTLSLRHDCKVRAQENKQEQKLLDEFTSRQFNRKRIEDEDS